MTRQIFLGAVLAIWGLFGPLQAAATDAKDKPLDAAIAACWNIGALSQEARNVTVTVAVELDRDGKPHADAIKMIRYVGGTKEAAEQAYNSARRAIFRCGAKGFNLPPEKYEQWRSLELVFNPERMRIK